MFANRTDAGERLAAALAERGLEADLVLAIPRGGLPVARPVADELDAPLDVVVASKIGAPTNPELAVGAVASDGSVWYNDDVIDHLDVTDTYLERARREEADAARRKIDRYRESGEPPGVRGERVVVVDDGLATGATARACLRQLRDAGAAHVVLAVPVGAPDSLAAIESEADEVIALERPSHFGAVGQFYRSFGQVSDAEAMAYLER
ncbi:phosphoribosyltransferase [Natrononativus amylolyticus]|uniref:phosphoribosyltransferase n=1 Tax=Natrononativus amylolyticus TaxID=2963434 RepID=UPI0020CF827B|nr:phosphoribosyltransferase family protein [Natrononativus amylolyticus]